VEHIDVSTDGGIATVTFERPPVNALTRQVLRDLAAVFGSFADDRTVSAAIFRARGDRAFIAGQDLHEISEGPEDAKPSFLVDRGRVAREAFRAIRECAVPVIAAVDRAVIGGGVALVACCDIIVASDRSTFALTEINMGLLGASAHLVRMAGPYRAREMFLTGRAAPAAELAAAGAISRVVPPDQVQEVAMEYARTLAEKSPLALRLAKESMNRSEYLPFDEGYRLEQDYTARLLGLEDSREARDAFFEKRAPRWRWR
jgi:enoyl-CoA hydratase/carnithine racemase